MGREQFAVAYGFAYVFAAAGTFVGPPFAGMVVDVFGDYGLAMHFAGASILVAALTVLCPLRRKTR